VISYFLHMSRFAQEPIRKYLIESSLGQTRPRSALLRSTPAPERIRKKLAWRPQFPSRDQLRPDAEQEKPDRVQPGQTRPSLSASAEYAGARTHEEKAGLEATISFTRSASP